ncbi:MAG: phage holin family protein [Nitrospira sp.]|nr:phage holin family protein [Nitrospira sp.]MCP9464328.1 phage holin family protein [Nitrospira sp.]
MAIIRFFHLSQESFRQGGLRNTVLRILITGVAVFLAVATVPGLEVENLSAGIATVLVLTILNVIVRPILLLITLPLIVFTLGLFLVILNALLLALTAFLVKGFTVSGFWSAVGGALVISIVTTVLNHLTVDRHPPPPFPPEPGRPLKVINPE